MEWFASRFFFANISRVQRQEASAIQVRFLLSETQDCGKLAEKNISKCWAYEIQIVVDYSTDPYPAFQDAQIVLYNSKGYHDKAAAGRAYEPAIYR